MIASINRKEQSLIDRNTDKEAPPSRQRHSQGGQLCNGKQGSELRDGNSCAILSFSTLKVKIVPLDKRWTSGHI